MKLTESLCPVCYSKIPAVVYIDGCVLMKKTCPIHGEFISVVERDPEWFKLAQDKEIYDGYLIDVTSKCNIKCAYCYHDNNGSERTVDDIYRDALENKHLAPFILTGGEPTLHKDLKEIILKLKEIGEVNLLTNGIRLCDEKYFDEIMPLLSNENCIHDVSLSFHKESEGKDLEFLELCKKKGIKIWTCFYVIDDLKQIDQALELFRVYVGTVDNFRIKIASNLGIENKAENKLFVSDIIRYLMSLEDDTEFQPASQKVSYGQVWHDGIDIKIISWYDVNNIDLWDIDCAPYWKANDGTISNFVTSAIINEGIEKKKFNIRRAFQCDIPQCADLWVGMCKEEKPDCEPHKNIWISKMYEFIKQEQNHLYVAELNGEIVAFVSGYWHWDELTGDKEIIGLNFYVKPELRKTDIGKKLHLQYLDTGHKLGVKKVVRKVTKEHAPVLFKKGQEFTYYIIEERI
jgi:organic radical activating enzyme/GNAT superfamily N-acetyltransferase